LFVEGTLKRTPLFEMHLKHGARMVPFGGWEMPVQYTGLVDEHKAVREAAGLFDVSHMGEFEVQGPQALDLIQLISVNNAAKLEVGQIQYSLMCYENGTIVDDILVYRLGENHYWLVVNAGNIDKDWEWVSYAKERSGLTNLELTNISGDVAQIAIQGPNAERIMQPLVPNVVLDEMKFYTCKSGATVAGIRSLVLSRTGYTGEDGFEIYCKKEDAVALWEALLEAGEEAGLIPAGLGARDTLRFEAKLPLYGHEISDKVTPLEAGLSFAVKFKKGVDFIGKAALEAQKAEGVAKKLVGFEMIERGIARGEYEIAKDGQVVGHVTTGSPSPTLGKNIGMAFVPVSLTDVGTEFDVIIRGKATRAKVVETPFYQPRYKR
jgi:aminomethyltransferase